MARSRKELVILKIDTKNNEVEIVEAQVIKIGTGEDGKLWGRIRRGGKSIQVFLSVKTGYWIKPQFAICHFGNGRTKRVNFTS